MGLGFKSTLTNLIRLLSLGLHTCKMGSYWDLRVVVKIKGGDRWKACMEIASTW